MSGAYGYSPEEDSSTPRLRPTIGRHDPARPTTGRYDPAASARWQPQGI